MQTLWQDVRFGARMLLKSPGFSLVAVITLALGIGANTAIFSVVYAVLLRSLPYPEADRLVMVWERSQRREQNVINLGNFYDWKAEGAIFEDMAAFADYRTNLTGRGEPVELPAQIATDNLFAVLSVHPILGRSFSPEDARPGQDDVVMLSYGLWQRQFGGDPGIIGQKLQLNNTENTVIGVLPPGFKWHIQGNSLTGQPAELWKPWNITAPMRERRGRFASAVGRLRPGVSLSQARAAMDRLAVRLADQYKDFNLGWGINVVPLREQIAGDLRPALRILMGAVGFVLLIACANVANLLLARAAGRRKEMAVRASLGAGKGRIVRQLLTESLLLAVLGGVVGGVLAWVGISMLVALIPRELSAIQSVELNTPIFGFTLTVALLTGLLFGTAPAWDALHINLNDVLKPAGKSGASGPMRPWMRNALVLAEFAMALILLVGAGLLIRSFVRLRAVETGFIAQNVLTFRVGLPGRRYKQDSQTIQFFNQALSQLRALPEVESAGVINFLPLAGPGAGTNFEIEGRPKPLPGNHLVTGVCVTDTAFFQTMRIPLKRGRLFSDTEIQEPRHVVLINEALARKYFPAEDPIGKRITIYMKDDNAPSEIIGILADVKHGKLDGNADPMSYWPIAELPYNTMTFALRTRGEMTGAAAGARRVIHALDPQQPVTDLQAMESLLSGSIARQRFNTLLLAIFAGVALALSAIGIYGVMSYVVTQRTHEIGIRAALGATRRDLLALLMRQGMGTALFGVGLGLIGAGWLAVYLRSFTDLLYNFRATDPWVFGGIAAGLSVVAAAACYLPARRAARIDPMTALREE